MFGVRQATFSGKILRLDALYWQWATFADINLNLAFVEGGHILFILFFQVKIRVFWTADLPEGRFMRLWPKPSMELRVPNQDLERFVFKDNAR